jgi:cytidylate kinase
MKVIQIKGANGTGKTTLVKDLISLSSDILLYIWQDNGKVFATGMEDLGWIAIGEYKQEKKMGGCDCMKSIAEIKQAIDYCRKLDYRYLVFEGAMISTIKSTFYDYLINDNPLYVMLVSSLTGCMDRIASRGTKPGVLKGSDNIKAKIRCIERQIEVYNPKYVRIINVDKTPREAMLKAFLEAVGDKELLKQV